MGEINAYKYLVRIREEKRPFRRCRRIKEGMSLLKLTLKIPGIRGRTGNIWLARETNRTLLDAR